MTTKSSSVFSVHAPQLQSASLVAITPMTRMPFYKFSFLTPTLNHPIATDLASEGIGHLALMNCGRLRWNFALFC